MPRDEDELLSGDAQAAIDEVIGSPVFIADSGAAQQIEDVINSEPLETDENPFLPRVVDHDPEGEFFDQFGKSPEEIEAEAKRQDDPDLADDLHEKMQDQEVAGEGGVSDLAKAARLIEMGRDKSVALAPPVRINPQSAYRGLLGGQATAAPGTVVQVVQWEGEDVEALPVSVAFAPSAVPLTTTDYSQSFVRIEFGTRGGKMVFDVDIGAGGVLTVPASSIYVSVGSDTGSFVSTTLIASIGFYTALRTTPLTRTAYLSLASGASTTATVTAGTNRPFFANQVMFDRDDPTAPYLLEFFANGALVQARQIAANTYLTNPIQLAGDVGYVVVTNQGGATSRSRLIWIMNL